MSQSTMPPPPEDDTLVDWVPLWRDEPPTLPDIEAFVDEQEGGAS